MKLILIPIIFLQCIIKLSNGYVSTSVITDNKIKVPSGGVLDTKIIGNLKVPAVGIGTISWSSDKYISIENGELENLMDEAWKSNAAFLDTAERYGSHLKTAFGLGYGETEKLVARGLTKASERYGTPRLGPVVATKFTPTPWRTTAESVVDACQQSCRNLGVEKIDLYQIHMPDIVQPLRVFGKDQSKDKIYWEGLAECYNRGLVKNIGVCNYGPTLLSQCQEYLFQRGVPLASNQIGYSLIGRSDGAQETVDKCLELGIKPLAFFPFAMGLLTGKYSSGEMDDLSDESLFRSKKSQLELRDLKKYVRGDSKTIPKGGISPLLRVMELIAEKRNKTVAQVALNYIICKGAIPIPGARTIQQMRDNIGSMGWRLTDTEVAMLELEADQLGFGFNGAGFKRTNEKFVGYGVEKFYLN